MGYSSSDQDHMGKDEWVQCRSCDTHIEKWDAVRTGGICPNCGDSEGVHVEPDVMPDIDYTVLPHIEVISAGNIDDVMADLEAKGYRTEARFRSGRRVELPDPRD